MRRLLFIAVLIATLPLPIAGQELRLPNKPGSVKFAVIGDAGTGDKKQLAIANELSSWRTRYPFEFVVMMGDNLYGGESPRDFDKKFTIPYKSILDAGVKFYAALGNHDDAALQRNYKPFNMNGERFYSFKPQAWRPLLCARQQLRGQVAARLARQAARGQRVGMEDHVLPSPAVFVGRDARLSRTAARPARAGVHEVWRQRRADGP